jgi:hypothetical protein
MGLGRELRTAATLVVAPDRVGAADAAACAPALAWLPVLGVAAGGVAALAVGLAGALPELAAVALAVTVLAAGGGRRPSAGSLLVGVAETAALALLPAAGRPVALLVAPMLARWACVVQCYGGTAAPGSSGLAALAGRVGFREFGIASVTALGAALVLLDAVGLAVGVVSALATLAVRVGAYRWTGGITPGAIRATSALVETSALVALALLGRMLGAR